MLKLRCHGWLISAPSYLEVGADGLPGAAHSHLTQKVLSPRRPVVGVKTEAGEACLSHGGRAQYLERVAFTWVHATRSTSLFFEHLHTFR